MAPATYLRQSGALAFLARMRALYPHKLFQVATCIGRDFRTRYYVEVMIDGAGPREAYWVGCGPLSREGAARARAALAAKGA